MNILTLLGAAPRPERSAGTPEGAPDGTSQRTPPAPDPSGPGQPGAGAFGGIVFGDELLADFRPLRSPRTLDAFIASVAAANGALARREVQ